MHHKLPKLLVVMKLFFYPAVTGMSNKTDAVFTSSGARQPCAIRAQHNVTFTILHFHKL